LHKVLVIEDDIELGSKIADALEREGMDVYLKTNLSGMPDFLDSHTFDLIIVDVILKRAENAMPENTLSLVWRAKQKAPDCPVITISGSYTSRGMQNILEIAERMGADRTLAKPFEIKDLISLANDCLRS